MVRHLALVLLASIVANCQTARDLAKIPLYFEENRGQTGAPARYIARTGGLVAFLTQDGWTLSLHGEPVSMRIAGANPKAAFTGEGTVEGISNYYLGSRAITGLPHYSSVRVAEVRPGIDIVYHASEHNLEYDFVVRPDADPSALRLHFDEKHPPILTDGDLVFKTGSGELRQRKPRVWQIVHGRRRQIECRYALSSPNQVELILQNHNRSAELLIDPVLAYSTFLGGTNNAESATGVAADSSGYAYVTGYTGSTDFPVTGGTFHGGSDAFVTKFNTSGSSLIYSTFVGGAGQDQANGIALDNAGNAYITGLTYSSDFPFTINHYVGSSDAFVAKLGPTGNIIYCTALGGSNLDIGTAIAVDTSGSAYITGYTYSGDFPSTTGSYRTALAGADDAFVAKLLPSGQISYATYLGGGSYDGGTAIAVDASGNAFVGGTTSSSNFPVTQGAFATTLAGGQDAFIAKLNPTGSGLVYSTYFGGSSSDTISGLAVDAAGNSYEVGYTQSSDFPTTPGAFATTKPSPSYTYSAFAAKLNATGSALVYSTFLGGNGNDSGTAIAVDLSGAAFLAGTTQSDNFPTTPGALRTRPSNFCCDADIFLVKVSVDGSALSYSTLLGSTTTNDIAGGLALDGNSGIYVAGSTTGVNYPTTSGAYQTVSLKQSYNQTVVLSKIDFSSAALCNPSVSPQGQSLPGRGGAISFNLTLSPGCPWESIADNFITVGPPNHGVVLTSPLAINGTVPLNDSTASVRTGTVRIGQATFTVTQDAGSCQDPVLSPMSVAFDSSGGIRNMNLILPSSCAWLAASSSPWLSVNTNPGGNGSATITIFAGQNSFSPRTATLTIAGKPIMVTQSGSTCTAAANVTPLTFPAQGGTGLARITTNSSSCQWAAYNSVPWIQVAALSHTGQGSGNAPFVIASNPGSQLRSGQILIADQLLMITQSAGPAGTVSGFTMSPFAGGGPFTLPNFGDGGLALGAHLNSPNGLAVDPATAKLYIAEAGPSRIRVVTPDGNIDTFAGGGSATGENIPATSALLNPATSYVAVDNTSAVYLNDSFTRVRAVSQGSIATFAGTTVSGFFGDNGPATSAKLSSPSGIAADAMGNVYIGDTVNNRIRKVNGGTITTFAGGGNSGLGDNGPATSATLASPQGVAVDSAGNLLIADAGNGRIRKVSQGNISTVAGGGSGGDGGPATSASLYSPSAVAVDPLGDLFIIESNYNRLRMVSLDGKISTIGGFYGTGLATDPSGNLYVSDFFGALVRKLTPIPSFCTYSVSTPATLTPNSATLPISVTSATGCNWTAVSDLPWLTLSSGSPGTANGIANFTVASNPSSSPRTGTIVVAGQSIQITQAAGQEIGFVDLAGDAQGNPTVNKGATLYTRGWAADTAGGAPVQSVTIFIDGNSVGTATLGSARPDVAQAFNRSDYTNSGWSFQISTSSLTAGQHTVTATGSGPSGTALLVKSPKVTITVPSGQEIGFVDLAGNAQGGSTVPKGATLYVGGWATDTSTGAPVQTVTVFIDGNSVGTATLGSARPDVAQAYNRSDYTNSGWSFQMSTAALSVGQHSVTATAAGNSGTGPLTGTRTFTVAAGGGQEIGFVDMAGDAQGGSTVGKGATLFVRGWATDTVTGAPVQSVTVFVDGNSAGLANLGDARPDVAQAYSRSDYTNSGWDFQMPAGSLSLGQHAVTANAAGPSGTGPLTITRTINVVAGGGQEVGYVDMAGDAQGGGTISQTGTLYVRGWAADTASGAPVQTVTVFLDGNSIGIAALGGSRPDVASAFNRSDYTNSGWSFQISAGSLSTGQHSITATATGSSGTGPLLRTRTINVTP